MFRLLARLIPAPDHPIIELGQPLPTDRRWLDWSPTSGSYYFVDCEHRRWVCPEGGFIRIGIQDDVVMGVHYGLECYQSPMQLLRKARYLADAHGLRFYLDNKHGADIYLGEHVHGMYAYRVDWFFVHTKSVQMKTFYSDEEE